MRFIVSNKFAALAAALTVAAAGGSALAVPRETVLYSFRGGSDGRSPEGGLIADSAGNLYGTTNEGGASNFGTIFKLAPDGTETLLHVFTSGGGEFPTGSLLTDGNGNLYGTTSQGGGTGCDGFGCGVVFKLAPDGTYTVLYSFAGGRDGRSPIGGLIADNAGKTITARCSSWHPKHLSSPFSAVLNIAFGSAPLPALAFGSDITLSSTAPAIDLSTQPVTLQAGNFTATIPPGSFISYAPASFFFEGVIGGCGREGIYRADGHATLQSLRGGVERRELDRNRQSRAGNTDHRPQFWHNAGQCLYRE